MLVMDSVYATIARLVFEYAERLDRGDLVGMSRLFAQATLRTSSATGITTFTGSDEVFAAYDASVIRYEDGTPKTKHVTTNLIVEWDEGANVATARSYFTVFQSVGSFPLQPIVAGRYEDRFVRDEQSPWRFADRLITIEFSGNLGHHLAVSLPRAEG